MFVSSKQMLIDARENRYGVMAMNCCNLEMARGAINAAEALRASLILQISPKQMKRHAHAEEMCPLIKTMAERAAIPVCLNFDHGKSLSEIVGAIRMGFSNVMFDGSQLPYDENVKMTKIICAKAHLADVTVEAELGHVGMAQDYDECQADFLTDPNQAKDFIQQTGVDSLAVAIGTAHGAYPKGKKPVLDFERLRAIREAVSVPLVLHGGSGSGKENIQAAIRFGISKINVATDAFETARNGFISAYQKEPDADYIALSASAEQAVFEFVRDYLNTIGNVDRIAAL